MKLFKLFKFVSKDHFGFMREPLKDRIRLEHILTAINNVFQYTDGKTIQQLNDDTMLFYATVKNVEIIGEAAYQIYRTERRGDRSLVIW